MKNLKNEWHDGDYNPDDYDYDYHDDDEFDSWTTLNGNYDSYLAYQAKSLGILSNDGQRIYSVYDNIWCAFVYSGSDLIDDFYSWQNEISEEEKEHILALAHLMYHDKISTDY